MPSAHFIMSDTNAYEFKLNNKPWEDFVHQSGSQYQVFITSGEGLKSEGIDGTSLNKIRVRRIGGTLESIYEWKITIPALHDGQDFSSGGDRPWHVLTTSDIATLGTDPLVELGYRVDAVNPDHPTFFKAGTPWGGRIFFVTPTGMGDGSLDSPSNPGAIDFAQLQYDATVHVAYLEGDYSDPDCFDYGGAAGTPLDTHFSFIAAPGARILQSDGARAVSFSDITFPLFQGFDIVAADHSGGQLIPTIEVMPTNGTRIDSCRIRGGNGHGIVIEGRPATHATPGPAEHVSVTNSEICDMFEDGEDRHGILIGPYTAHIHVLGNHIYQNSGDALQIYAKESRNTALPRPTQYATSVTIDGNRLHDDVENALDIWSCRDLVVRNNLMYGYSMRTSSSPASPAIKMHHSVGNALVEFNQISYSRIGADLSDGFEGGWDDSIPEPKHYPHEVVFRRNVFSKGENSELSGATLGTTIGIRVLGAEQIDIANNHFQELGRAAGIHYAVIPPNYDNGQGSTVTHPIPGVFVNNLMVDIDSQFAFASIGLEEEFGGSVVWAQWPSTTAIVPNAYVAVSPSQEAEFEVGANPAVHPLTIQARISVWGDPGVAPSFIGADEMQSGIVPSAFVMPTDLGQWLNLLIADLNAPGFNMDFSATGLLITGLTDELRDGLTQNPPNIGVY